MVIARAGGAISPIRSQLGCQLEWACCHPPSLAAMSVFWQDRPPGHPPRSHVVTRAVVDLFVLDHIIGPVLVTFVCTGVMILALFQVTRRSCGYGACP